MRFPLCWRGLATGGFEPIDFDFKIYFSPARDNKSSALSGNLVLILLAIENLLLLIM